MSGADDPLILTLQLDEKSFARFEAERRRHFPPARNKIPAHLTLFHHLPGAHYSEIAGALAQMTAQQNPFGLEVTGLRFLGQGTAYQVTSPDLLRLRAKLAERWAADLTRQNAQGYRPHITIQNKAAPDAAKQLFESLTASFEPFTAQATGLLLWWYRGGPWEPAGMFAFGGATASTLASAPTG